MFVGGEADLKQFRVHEIFQLETFDCNLYLDCEHQARSDQRLEV